jgi:hypothetical protein
MFLEKTLPKRDRQGGARAVSCLFLPLKNRR